MNTLNIFKLVGTSLLTVSLLSACGGSSNDPKVDNVPVTPDVTHAEIAGTIIKGVLSNADIAVTALNGSNLTINSASNTDQEGRFFIELSSEAGFGINSTVKLNISTTDSSTMQCDALRCGDAEFTQLTSGAAIAGSVFSTLGQLTVPYGNDADGVADTTLQANALTTLATQLVEQQIADGRNVSTAELMTLAQAQMSALLLRTMGWQTGNTNVFNMAVISADKLDNFILGESCEENDSAEQVCSTQYADEAIIKLSLLNASFAQFSESDNLKSVMDNAQQNIRAALNDDADALAAFRQRIYDAISSHPLTTELGLTADSIVDLSLPLFDEALSTGPLQEITTQENLTGAVFTARNAISDAESAAKAFDNNLDTKWLDHNDWLGAPSEASPSWIQVDFAKPQAVNSVFITSANDAPERDPENFTILGSNDGGKSWFELANIIGASFEDRLSRQEFSFVNGQKYLSYRVNITKNKNNDGLVQVSDIQMVGPVFTSVDHTDITSGTTSASNSIGDAENADKAFDNDPTTKWLDHNDWQGAPTEDKPSWIQMDFVSPVAVDQLVIVSANDAPERDPENFALLASNDDGTTWQKLATWVGESFDSRAQRRAFSFSNQLAFSSYRLEVTKNKNNDGLLQIADIDLIGPELPGEDHSKVAGASYSARNSISDSEGAAQAFDNNVNTKWLDHNDWQGPPTNADPAWLQVILPQAKAVNTLTLTSASDAPERDPESFTLMASMDDENWLDIGAWVGESFDQRLEKRTFPVANTLAYSHYRLAVTKNANNDGLVQIAEVGLIGPDYAFKDLTSLTGSVFSARFSIGDAESADKAFDGDIQTKWLDHNDWQGAPTEENPAWIQVDFSDPQTVSGLAITSANDAPERDPENFSLLGSNDGGQTWTVVSSWLGESWDERLQRRSFEFNNGFAFLSYRLSISKNANNDGLLQIAEIELLGLEK
ncbi:discoidin domain-containing protein [Pseudoalteromonas sp. SG44-8]|uniref:discoidin domain-containing protein n=1 Tax=Pseudoalteromonas sp. SG44-8 TaxID=2760958 RepID=UPI0015FFB5E5|nr:discoidin domain-containing protein [Pseudoalteromonas sp. SG44-8]MBB1396471.1 discoidin domain-containing protein [Pseudoalteromonas sp. SG44-8]